MITSWAAVMQSSEIRLRIADELARLPASWGDFDCSRDDFVRHVVDRQAADAALRISDLWLAFACSRGCERAIAVLDREQLVQLAPHLAKMGLSSDQIAETVQRVRCEILLGTATQPPLIVRYQGRGALGAFVRAVATRIAFRVLRDSPRRDPASSGELAAIAGDERGAPQRRLYAEAFSRGLRQALDSLARRDRTLLRQVFVDRLSIDGLAAQYQVHRATAARWVQRAKDSLRAATYDHVSRALGVAAVDLDSVARWVRSQVELSLHQLHSRAS
jgi:RNA polymerase sigma-70 factor (ECF subfamily)